MKHFILIIVIFSAQALYSEDGFTVDQYLDLVASYEKVKDVKFAGEFVGNLKRAIDKSIGAGCKVKLDESEEKAYQDACNQASNLDSKSSNSIRKEELSKLMAQNGYKEGSINGIINNIAKHPEVCKQIISATDSSVKMARYIREAIKKEASHAVIRKTNACQRDAIDNRCEGLQQFKEQESDLKKLMLFGNTKDDFGHHFSKLPVAENCECVNRFNTLIKNKFSVEPKRLKKIQSMINKGIEDALNQQIKQDFNLAIEDIASDDIDPSSIKECKSLHSFLKKKNIIDDSLKELSAKHVFYTPPPGINKKTKMKVTCSSYSKSDYIKLSHLALDAETANGEIAKVIKSFNFIRTSLKNNDYSECVEAAFPNYKQLNIVNLIENLYTLPKEQIQKLKCSQKTTFERLYNRVTKRSSISDFIANLTVASQVSPMLRQYSQLPIEDSILEDSWINDKTSKISIEVLEKNKNKIAALQCGKLEEKARKIKALNSGFIGRLTKLKKNRDIAKINDANQLSFESNDLLSNNQTAEIIDNIYKSKFNDPMDKIAFYQFTSKSYCEMNSYTKPDDNSGKLVVTKPIDSLSYKLPSKKVKDINEKNKMLCGKKVFNPFHEWAEGKCYETAPKSLADSIKPEYRDCFLKGISGGCSKRDFNNIKQSIDNYKKTGDIKSISKEAFKDSNRSINSSNSTQSFVNNTSNQRAIADFNKVKTTRQYSNTGFLQSTKELQSNNKEKDKILNKYSDLLSKTNKSDSDNKMLSDLESRFQKLEAENQRLKNRITSMSRDKDNNDSKNSGRSIATNIKKNSPAQFNAAKNYASDAIQQSGKSIPNLSASGAQVMKTLSGRQLASLAYQVAGNERASDPVRIEVEEFKSDGLVNALYSINDPLIIDKIKKAIIQQRSIVISSKDGKEELIIEYGSKEYIEIANSDQYKKVMNKFIDAANESNGRAIASEVQKNYQELLNNSLNFVND